MPDKSATKRKPVGVIGAGSFGTAIANLLSINTEVLLFSRKAHLVEKINTEHKNLGVSLSPQITATNDLQLIAESSTLIFLIVPSANFRSMMRDLSHFLKPYHILIHGTKGFDLNNLDESDIANLEIKRSDVHTMSEVIAEESVVVRIGCLSGPNLAREIIEGQPTATVIASKFSEVIKSGRRVLNSKRFHVFGSHELMGAELAGALKNAIALGAGALDGYGFGKNLQAMLITRGLMEMVYFGKSMGANTKAFIGTAGIGDLVATATSEKSRNYTFGMRMSRGETLEEILNSMPEVAEGVRTIAIMEQLRLHYKIHAPIAEMLHKFVFHQYNMEEAVNYLMNYPYGVDVDFL